MGHIDDAAVCVVAYEYKARCVQDAKEEICLYVCCCNKHLYQPNKRVLKQICVDRLMAAKKTSQRGIWPEVPFDMTKTPPQVITDDAGWAMTTVPRWSKVFSDEERMRWRAGLGQDPNNKPIRIPDVVVLKDPRGQITQANINMIYEIKFPPDDWKDGQEKAYEKIAGDRDKVEKLGPGPKECNCDRQEWDRRPETAEEIQKANDLAAAAERKLSDLLKEAANAPLADFEMPEAVELWRDMQWEDFAREYPTLSKVAGPAMMALSVLAAARGGGRMPLSRWPGSAPVPAGGL